MRYFGVPTCPYCKKRVNLIRTWSLKRQGEYQCPRCNGISNIYLSPLIYVLGLLAVFAGGSLYFFHKFVLDDISLETALYIFVPFAAFFLFSLFMVYLEKPVIKKISREEYEKKRLFSSAVKGSPRAEQDDDKDYYDPEDYIPRGTNVPGPNPQADELGSSGVVNQAAFRRARQQAAMENVQVSQRVMVQKQGSSTGNHSANAAQQHSAQRPVQRTAVQSAARPAAQAQRPVAQNAVQRAPQYSPQYQQQRNTSVQNSRAAQPQRAQGAQAVQQARGQQIEPVPRRAVGQQSINMAQHRTAGSTASQPRYTQQHGGVGGINNTQPRINDTGRGRDGLS